MNKTIHYSEERGKADYGWLKARHSFSFANHYDPDRIHFGALRVLNDDLISGGMGFGMHPHDNMEIITIPLSGGVQHRDSMGNHGIVNAGEVQVMSAGSGITHAEYNASKDESLSLFQIWIFPDKKDVEPRYAQQTFDSTGREGKWQLLVSPKEGGSSLWIHQQAWLSVGRFKVGEKFAYKQYAMGSGSYIMLVDGEAMVEGEALRKRDAIGISGKGEIDIQIQQDSELLVIEVPMTW